MKRKTANVRKARKAQAPTYNRSEIAKAYGVSVQTIDAWVRRGCPHERRDNGRRDYLFKLDQVAAWRARQLAEDSQRRSNGGRREIPDGARDWLDKLIMGYAHVFPWNIDRTEGPERDQVAECIVTADEYRRESGIDGDEMLFRALYGLPLVPPAPDDPDQHIRISLPHARTWLFLFSGCIESLGGDGMAHRIAMEAQRLRGFPTYPNEIGADDGAGAEAGT